MIKKFNGVIEFDRIEMIEIKKQGTRKYKKGNTDGDLFSHCVDLAACYPI